MSQCCVSQLKYSFACQGGEDHQLAMVEYARAAVDRGKAVRTLHPPLLPLSCCAGLIEGEEGKDGTVLETFGGGAHVHTSDH
jgi:hypothetical protein